MFGVVGIIVCHFEKVLCCGQSWGTSGERQVGTANKENEHPAHPSIAWLEIDLEEIVIVPGKWIYFCLSGRG